jgi:hypothetical protein
VENVAYDWVGTLRVTRYCISGFLETTERVSVMSGILKSGTADCCHRVPVASELDKNGPSLCRVKVHISVHVGMHVYRQE